MRSRFWVTTRQYVQFSAPEGMDSEEAKAWFDEHRDDEGAIVFEEARRSRTRNCIWTAISILCEHVQ